MFSNKTVLVTGGSGYIGAEICKAFASYGARVLFTYHENKAAADCLLLEIPGSKALEVNFRDLLDIKVKIEKLHQEGEGIDILVNNAGASQVMPFSLIEADDLDFLIDVNIKGTFFMTKAVVRRMIKNRKGTIVNIGSIAGMRLLDVPVHYALSKAAISGFTLSLAVELKRYGIRVNSVIPGLIEGGVSKGLSDELREDFHKHCTIGRSGTGKEVAELVCFLASDKASYINGQNIYVDGGI